MMTREEASKILKDMLRGEVMPVYLPERKRDAVRLAIAAIHSVSRERVERMRGEWRSIYGLSEYYCSRCGEEFEIHAYDKDKYQFCPYCMAPMTDEAVDMVMERLEALYETAE